MPGFRPALPTYCESIELNQVCGAAQRLNSNVMTTDPNATLNRLLVTLHRSLPMYLADAAPWTHHGDERARKVLGHIVADHRMYSGRIADLLLSRRKLISFSDYPMVFTDTHDLSLDYLIGELIFYQKQDIVTIQNCVIGLQNDSAGRTLAEEVLGNARGHLESLEELRKQPALAHAE